MSQKIKIDDVEYDLDNFSDQAKNVFKSLQFVLNRQKELDNMRILLRRAKNSYADEIKREMISNKSGFLFDQE
tara:strand:- start:448 stop:666 length:219 start_codon:yes stop_codon:yes gene_type:complete